jgi:hypothetical protein
MRDAGRQRVAVCDVVSASALREPRVLGIVCVRTPRGSDGVKGSIKPLCEITVLVVVNDTLPQPATSPSQPRSSRSTWPNGKRYPNAYLRSTPQMGRTPDEEVTVGSEKYHHIFINEGTVPYKGGRNTVTGRHPGARSVARPPRTSGAMGTHSATRAAAAWCNAMVPSETERCPLP